VQGKLQTEKYLFFHLCNFIARKRTFGNQINLFKSQLSRVAEVEFTGHENAYQNHLLYFFLLIFETAHELVQDEQGFIADRQSNTVWEADLKAVNICPLSILNVIKVHLKQLLMFFFSGIREPPTLNLSASKKALQIPKWILTLIVVLLVKQLALSVVLVRGHYNF
jgi:hypothetical protein